MLFSITEPEAAGLSESEARNIALRLSVRARARYGMPDACGTLLFIWHTCGIAVDACTDAAKTRGDYSWYVRIHLWRPWPQHDISIVFDHRDDEHCWQLVDQTLGKFFKLQWFGFRLRVLADDIRIKFRSACRTAALLRGPGCRDTFGTKLLNLLGGLR